MHPVRTRPRWWVRQLQWVYLRRGRQSVIYSSVRKDLVPFSRFSMGACSVVEDYATLNNAVGELHIGAHTRIGMGNTLIGPVSIGNHVNLAQNVVVSGLNHNFQEVGKLIAEQGVSTAQVHIDNDVWIGANSVVLAGVSIGEHVVVGAGSVVTRDLPPYSVAVGNPAKVIRMYNFETKEWSR